MNPNSSTLDSHGIAVDSRASEGSVGVGLDFVASCYEFPPWPLAGAIWTEKLLIRLRDRGWRFEVITAAPSASLPGVAVHHVPNGGGPAWLSHIDRIKLSKIREWVTWPDDAIYWNDSAVRYTHDVIREKKTPDDCQLHDALRGRDGW
jgi:hypothetical protein